MLRGLLPALLLVAGVASCDLVVGPLPDGVDKRDASGASGSGGAAGSAGSGTDASAGRAGAAGEAGSAGSGGGSGKGGSGGTSGSGGAGGAATGGSGGCDPCDCDGDGARAKSCGGNDCDDHDANVKPNQDQYFGVASATVGFDYNCNGADDRDPTKDSSITCTGISLGSCNTTTAGFFGAVPGCGQSADWGTCKTNTLSCVENPSGPRVMGCH